MRLRNFNDLSGPWVGLSIQDGVRISESIRLLIHEGRISGEGVDKDGEFELIGFYSARTEQVMITRRYSRTTEPSQSSVGIPYDYEGKWDGAMVWGTWHARNWPKMGGPFEMWPYREEDQAELRIETQQVQSVTGSGR